MRHMLRVVTLAAMFGGSFILPAVAKTSTCGSDLFGGFSVLVNGANSSTGVPKMLVGQINFNDSTCTVSGTASTSVNNVVSLLVPVAGTFVLNSDKTYTITLTAPAAQRFVVGYSSTATSAVGIEQDSVTIAAPVTAEVNLQAQNSDSSNDPLTYDPRSLEHAFVASCFSPDASTDLNYVTFDGTGNIVISSADYYNNGGNASVSPYSGTYTVTSTGLFGGAVTVGGNPFSFVGVISNNKTEIQYFYYNTTGGVTACTGHKT